MAQQARTITGKVIDGDARDKSGLPGASVIVQGSSVGTVTDIEGNYSLSVPDGGILVFSFVGYATQTITVGARATIDVTLELDVEQLAEVVVIGYGETSVKDATGSVVAVTAKDFNGGVIASPEQLIQGKTAGVQIASSSGEPGAGVNINIRGSNSVTSNNNPLFVVDGVPLGGGSSANSGANVGFGTSGSRNPLSFINPNDIESISILKDASATAIYGSRGANGVVIVTTKSGKGNDLKVTYSSTASVSTTAKRFDLLDRDQFLDAVAETGTDPSSVDFGNNIDWQDEVFRTAFSHSQNVSFAKGYKTADFRASLGYDNQQGIIEESGLERITARFNGNKSYLNDKLNFNLQLTGSRVNDQFAPLSGSAGFRGDLLGAVYSANPTWNPAANFEDIRDQIGGGQLHPNNILENHDAFANTNRLLLNFSASYELAEGLTGKLTYGVDKSESESFSFLNANAINADRGVTGNGRGALNELVVTNDLFEATLNYKKDFGNSNIDIVGGYSFQDFGSRGFNAEALGFASTDFQTMENDFVRAIESLESTANSSTEGFVQQFGFARPTGDPDNNALVGVDGLTGGAFANILFPNTLRGVALTTPAGINVNSVFVDKFDNTDKLQSFFGRVNYSIANKYLFTFTGRADGSSRFGENNRYGFFPSGAFAWQLGEEDFIGESFSTLKLRLSAGVTGNQDGLGFGNAIQRQRFGGTGIGDNGSIGIPGISDVAFSNPELQWESTTQLTAGLDFGFNNDRFYGSVDFYRKTTNDLLLRVRAALPAPFNFVFDNFDIDVINQGVELALNYDVIKKSDLNFTTSFNISVNSNELQNTQRQIDGGTIRGQGLTGAFSQRIAEGQPLFSFFIDRFSGFNDEGEPILSDIADRDFVDASALPTVNTGLSLNLSYKNWDFSTYFTGQFGHYVYNNTANAFFVAGGINTSRNVIEDVVGNGEAFSASAPVSTRFLEKADFVRLQNLSIGYSIPVSGNGFLDNLKISLNAQNLFLLSAYDGLDPEVSVQPGGGALLNGLPTAGIDYTAYPRARTFSLSINAAF